MRRCVVGCTCAGHRDARRLSWFAFLAFGSVKCGRLSRRATSEQSWSSLSTSQVRKSWRISDQISIYIYTGIIHFSPLLLHFSVTNRIVFGRVFDIASSIFVLYSARKTTLWRTYSGTNFKIYQNVIGYCPMGVRDLVYSDQSSSRTDQARAPDTEQQ